MPDVTADRSLPKGGTEAPSYYYEPKQSNISDMLQDKD